MLLNISGKFYGPFNKTQCKVIIWKNNLAAKDYTAAYIFKIDKLLEEPLTLPCSWSQNFSGTRRWLLSSSLHTQLPIHILIEALESLSRCRCLITSEKNAKVCFYSGNEI